MVTMFLGWIDKQIGATSLDQYLLVLSLRHEQGLLSSYFRVSYQIDWK